MTYWLLKSEADCYGIADLQRDGQTAWTGIRNYQARNLLRDELRVGDLCLFYHSNGSPSAAAGVCEVVSASYPDPTQFDPKDEHADPDSDPRNPRWFVVDVAYRETFSQPVPLDVMRGEPVLQHMKLLERGSRLSVLPVTAAEFRRVCALGRAAA
jgi:predicted RNA-binding protein with PUA-like domain